MTRDEIGAERPVSLLKAALIVATVVVVGVAATVFLVRQVDNVRQAAMRSTDAGRLKQFAWAAHCYADTNGDSLLGPYAQVSPGVLNTELSFRVGLLPYMEQHKLHGVIDLSQPWDSPTNSPATSTALRNLQSPDTLDRTKPDTPYRVFYGGGALFEADGKPVKLRDIPDGTSNTILFVHATETVPWAKPQEFAYTPTTPLPPLGSPGLGKGFNVAFADGSVRFLRHTIAGADLRSLIEKADGRGADIE